MLSPEYLAGFFDGEGTFHIGKQLSKNGVWYPNCKIMLSQSGDNGLALLTEIQSHFGGRIYQHLSAGQHKATKAAYKLYWRKQEAIEFIPKLLPFLRLKKAEAEEVLKYLTRD